jgi:hypothetical protein
MQVLHLPIDLTGANHMTTIYTNEHVTIRRDVCGTLYVNGVRYDTSAAARIMCLRIADLAARETFRDAANFLETL